MSHRHLRLGHEFGQFERQSIDSLDPIVQEKYLPAAFDLAQDGVADHPIVITGDVGLNRQPVHRRRFNDAQVTNADQRHVQGARDRRRGQAQDIDQRAHFFQPLFVHHAETVFFVDDHQSQIFEVDIFLQ